MISSPPTPVIPKAPIAANKSTVSVGIDGISPEANSPEVIAKSVVCNAMSEAKVNSVKAPIIKRDTFSISR